MSATFQEIKSLLDEGCLLALSPDSALLAQDDEIVAEFDITEAEYKELLPYASITTD